ncbi:MAG: VWA domain-containing protein, partial [Phycisphaerae bacterium]|nr:VWA domain-containing protein [Phycisphaerae bacterium]
MNWLPHILNPLSALIAAVVTVPILLILYFLKLRRREMPVASTLLWKKAIQDLQVNSPFQKLRRNLLFLLQLLLLLFLCLALSRPISSYTPGVGRFSVILIDRSASMNANDPAYHGRTRLDEAKRQAKDLIDSMQRGATAMVIAFDDKADTVQPFTADTVALKNAIDSIPPTDRRTRLKLAYQLAEAQINFDPNVIQANSAPPDVYVFSDGRVLDAAELAVRGNVQYRPIGTEDAGNIAIVAMSAKRNYEQPTQVQVFARFADYGPNPASADIELRVATLDGSSGQDDFKLRGTATVDLLPDRWTDQQRQGQQSRDSVEFTLDLTTAAVVRVEQKNKQDDCLAADDAAQVVVPPPKPLSLLLVTEGDYFLERLVQSLNLKNGQTMTPSEYESKLPTDFDVVIFDRAYAPPKLPPAGNFIFFGNLPQGLKLKQMMENGKPLFIDSTGVLDWQRDHPILKGLSLHKLRVMQAERLDVPADAQVLIDGIKGPLLVLDHEGHSTILAASFDLLQSDWPTSPSFPVFMYNALQYL